MPKRWLLSSLCLSCLFLGMDSRGASAGQATERVRFLHGDAEIGYDGSFQFGTLREEGEEVASYRWMHHQLNVDVEFGAAPLTEVYLRLPFVMADEYRFLSSNEMTYNPDTGRATMLEGTALEDDELLRRTRAGFGDMWIGVQFTPLSETVEKRWNPRGARATLLIDLGVKLPTGGSLYDDPSEGGTYKPGSGGADLRLGLAFSKRAQALDPYFTASFTSTGKSTKDLKNSDGEVTVQDALINPGNVFDVAFGTEILALESRETNRKVSLDLGAGWTYTGWGTQKVGTLIPTWLATTDGFVSTESEYMKARVNFGLYFQPVPVVQMRMNASVIYPFSHILERVDEENYQVSSGYDTLQLQLGITGAARF